jgi:leucyl-tRNA synthetase
MQKRWQEEKLFQSNPDNREKLIPNSGLPLPRRYNARGARRTYTVPDVYARINVCGVIMYYSQWDGTLQGHQ